MHVELIEQARVELAHASIPPELHIVVGAVSALISQSRLYRAVVFAKGLTGGVVSAIIALP